MKQRFLFVFMFLSVSAWGAEWQWSVPDGEARAYLWIPANCRHVRAVVVANHNMIEQGILEHPTMRRTLTELDMAEVWVVPYMDQTFDFNKGAGEHFQKLMDELAVESGYDELRTAPVAPLGHSACATYPWNFAAWNPARTLCVLSVHGDAPQTKLTGNGRPRIDWGDRNIDGVPGLMVMSEQEWWDDRLTPAKEFCDKHPKTAFTILKDAGRGHFDYSDQLVAYLAKFISDSAAARRPVLGHYRSESTHISAGTKPQLISINGQSGEPVTPPFEPQEDGITFRLKVGFAEVVADNGNAKKWSGLPAGAPLGHAPGPITLSRIVGPAAKVFDDTFVVRFGRAEYTNNGRNLDVWLVASHPGNDEYHSIAQQARVRINPNKTGADQHITFPEIPDQKVGTKSLKLPATSDAGLPVQYYVREGPAEVEGDTMKFKPIPLRSKFPVKVTVVAWQWGNAKVKTAERVERTFQIVVSQ